MTAPINFPVRVKYTAGAYVTNTINGKRASSTMSPEQAVNVLAHKLMPDRACRVRHVSGNVAGGHESWRIES